MDNKLLFEKSKADRRATVICVNASCNIDAKYARKSKLKLPQIAEVDLVRHYMGLSRKAHGVSNGFYPLGSCTMKYNPATNEAIASLKNFTHIHPLQPQASMQGTLEVMHDLAKSLCKITGMHDITLQPAAGAHGELTALMMIKAFHRDHGEANRNIVLVPDSAHGTNPASATMLGYEIKVIPSDFQGMVDIDILKKVADKNVAALMLTNPNTLGIFEKNISKIARIIHDVGGKLYHDGANMNAIMGITRPGDMGFDVMHLNLHKTFSTPHGGGGPGSGPVGCSKALSQYLPNPRVVKTESGYALEDSDMSIGKVKSFYGNFLVNLRAYTYILSLGKQGLKDTSKNAVLNANYMKHRLKDSFSMSHDGLCKHEFVMSAQKLKDETGINALDIAKTLLDYGIHPPTVYFPQIVPEAMMVEPTETESKETLDHACDILIEIANRAYKNPDELKATPTTLSVSRLDETLAARKPVIKFDK